MDSGFQLFTLERENDGEIGAGQETGSGVI
jgi:hypothetical protein